MATTIALVSGAVILTFAMFLVGVAALFTYLRGQQEPRNGNGVALETRVASLEVKIEGLPSLWEEERRRVERSADAARKARDAADRKLAAIAESEEEGGVVPAGDENGSEPSGLRDVQPGLGGATSSDLMDRARAIGWPWI